MRHDGERVRARRNHGGNGALMRGRRNVASPLTHRHNGEVDEQTEAMMELWVVRIEWRRDDDEARARRGRGGDGVALSPPRLAR